MNTIGVVARVTVKEASRRRLLAALAAISLAMVGLSAWGFSRFTRGAGVLPSGDARASTAAALIAFMFMFSFVICLSAVVIAAPAVSGELDSGVGQSVLVRPVRRWEVLLGKWCGMAAVVAAYGVAVGALEVLVVWAVSGYHPPNPAAAIAYLVFEGLVVLTLTLTLSTVLAPMTAGAVAVALFGAAWLAGVVGTIGSTLGIGSLQTAGRVAKVVLPTDGLWHGAIWYLEPASLFDRVLGRGGGRIADPFTSSGGPPVAYVVWAAAWVLLVFAAAVHRFSRTEP
ncbi:MAG TPA: ABC transporter permease subunit [Acidimicrobiales bacterium]|nr:ABC transporter permease subunit [Acidimicrobiales bacterium]